MNWPWSKPRPPPTDVLEASQASRDEMTAATDQLRDVVADLRAVVDEFKRAAAEHSGKARASNGD